MQIRYSRIVRNGSLLYRLALRASRGWRVIGVEAVRVGSRCDTHSRVYFEVN